MKRRRAERTAEESEPLDLDDIAIVVPSRKRADNMPRLRMLLPSAVVCVDEREQADYAEFVPEEKLLLHPPMEGAPYVRNWILANVQSKVVVQLDDDFRGVRVLVGSCRFITNPVAIRTIIENAAIACNDLGLGVFCFSCHPNAAMVKADWRPMRPVQPMFGAWGVMGPARRRQFRTDLPGRADADFCLRTLLEDRCVYADTRFYFDFGRIFSGRGGNVGLVTTEDFDLASKRLQETWGDYVSFKSRANFQKKRATQALSIRVSRTNEAAQR